MDHGGLQFDLTINLGQVIEAICVMLGGVAVFTSMRFEIRAASDRLAKVELDMDKVAAAMITLARQDEQIKGVRAALDRQDTTEQSLLQRIALLESRRP